MDNDIIKKEYEKQLDKEKEKVIDQILDDHPDMSILDKDKIKNNILGINNISSDQEIILEEFSYKGRIYYKDNYNNILNEDAKLVGCISENNDYNIFDDINFKLKQIDILYSNLVDKLFIK